VRRIALDFEEVESVHDVQIHEYGNMRLITLHVEMDAAATAIACHKLTERVEDAISARFDAKVIVHGDPVDLSHPDYKTLARALNSLAAETRDFVDFHDLRVADARPNLQIEVDLVTRTAVASCDFESKADQAAAFIKQRIPGIGWLQIGIETSYASDPEYRKRYPE